MRTIFWISLLLPHFLYAREADTSYTKLKEEIFYNLFVLDAYSNHNGSFVELDAWELADKTAGQLTRLLRFPQSRELDSLHFRNLKLSLSTDDTCRIRIYEFGFHCGGTMGWIDHAVMQWQSRNGALFSYNLNRIAELNYSNIYKLKEDSIQSTYLLIGRNSENAYIGQETAMVFRFQGDYFFTNQKTFANDFGVQFYNADVTFDPVTKILSVSPFINERGTGWNGLARNENSDSASTSQLEALFNEFPDPENALRLKWNGRKFVNIGPAKKADE